MSETFSRFLIALIPSRREGLHGYAIALVLVWMALALRLVLAPVDAGSRYVAFFPAVVLSVVLGGFWPGLLAIAMGLLFATFIFTAPYYSVSISAIRDSFWQNVLFLAGGLIVCFSLEAMYRCRLWDIRELKKTKEAHDQLQRSAQHAMQILDNLFTYVALLGTDGVVLEVNKAALIRSGFRREDVLGGYFHDAPWWTFDEQVRGQLMEAIEAARGGQTRRYDTTAKMGDELVPVDFQISPVRDNNGKIIGLLPMAVDISVRKQTEKALKDGELRFKTLAAATFEGIAVSAQGKILDVNDQLTYMLGYDREELIGRQVTDLISPEDRNRVISNIQAERNSLIECETLCKDGSRIIVEAHGQTIEQQGLPLRLTAIRDITGRKRYQKEARLAATLYEFSREAMVITDSANNIVSVNPAFTEITGYSADEVLGRNPGQLCPGHRDDAFYQGMLHSLATTNHWEGEVWDKKKNGAPIAVAVSINAIPDDTGSGRRYAAQFSDITEKKKMDEIISRQANFDSLTGLTNRRMFHDLLEQEIKKSHRSHDSLALLFIDLDRFKDVNDTLGHAVGDKLLVKAAKRIVDCVRESDIVSRLGGDEFTVILSELTEVSRIENVAHAIVQSLGQPYHLGEEGLSLSASIGISIYPSDATNPDDLIRYADQAMYLSKSEGRNCYHFFTEQMQESALKRHQLAQDLHSALAGNQFLLYFQPIVDLKSGELFKAEALLRWRHPVRGMIGPAEFIPVAEEIGLIAKIGDWVFNESLKQGRRWAKLIGHTFRIGINMSPGQFVGKAHHTSRNRWVNRVRDLKLSAASVSIEITERTLRDERPEVVDSLLAVHESGMEVGIDNFGTGYSPLSSLRKFKIDYLKIDHSVIRDLAPGSGNLALAEAIIALAHKLGMKVIAEGIETAVQRDLLVAAGCDFGQGYLFSIPVPGEEFEKLLRNRLVSEPTFDETMDSSDRDSDPH